MATVSMIYEELKMWIIDWDRKGVICCKFLADSIFFTNLPKRENRIDRLSSDIIEMQVG